LVVISAIIICGLFNGDQQPLVLCAVMGLVCHKSRQAATRLHGADRCLHNLEEIVMGKCVTWNPCCTRDVLSVAVIARCFKLQMWV